ncbi:hypothetical protein SAMN06269185_0757 [Natronoarchaeum philippinense]|uniref:Uncharacterized protein n=1 Tax=Natronoarchaeum philippinense TaxID=558529 RepID=A0A285N6K3_NATPI|nr:hypothetical protein [Natronoarchaeum philippinense]SNZ05040.1 hypothetical protein SAMN06269185_0757 [Natronoarchaeum philippinense]
MSSKGQVPDYSRQDLRKATRFVEGDYKGINPREFYRRLKRRLEEFQVANDFKYQTFGDQRQDLNILSENVGEKTGRIEGRQIAESDWELIGNGSLEYKPYGPHGALAIIIGLLLAVVGGLSQDMRVAAVGIVAVLAGGYMYLNTETGSFPLVRRDVIRVLMTGEVSERTIEDADETRTDIFANMSVIYAGDTLVNVYTNDMDDMSWTLRFALMNQVKRWYNSIVAEDYRKNVDDGFFGHLGAWTSRSVRNHRQPIENLQADFKNSFELREAYTETLLDELSADMQAQIDDQHDEVRSELEELADEMDVYVDREGLEPSA